MANTIIQLKHSTVTGNTPASLANGEISINSRDGKLFYSTPLGVVTAFNPYPGPSGLDTELQFNDGGSLGGSEKLTFNKTTGLLTVNGTVRANIFSDDGVDIFNFANNAYNTANAAFAAANTSNAASIAAVNLTQNNSITAAFIAANSAGVYANGAFAAANLRATTANASIAWNTANAAFVRANNSLDANNGGTVTGTITATAFITTGSFGNITGANTIYANNFVANTGFIQFSDGSKQYTANAGSGGASGTSANGFGVIYTANNNTYANAATANAQLNFVGESGVYVFANSITKTITVAGTPGAQGMTVDYGYVYEPTYYAVDYGTL
jgi:hypothetical protein